MMTKQHPLNKASEVAVKRYFEAFNANDFDAAAALFAKTGELRPPFGAAIVGPAAIARYLEQEAVRMTAYPEETCNDDAEDGQLRVTGQVDAIAFRVGVEWTFSFTETSKIQSLSIRLIASMKELLTMRPA